MITIENLCNELARNGTIGDEAATKLITAYNYDIGLN